MSQTVYISRDLKESEELERLLRTNGIVLLASSMIKTESISFSQPIPNTDWIFFSSKNAVRYFFEQQPEIKSQRMAAVGRGTAEVLEEFTKVDFVGNNIDTHITAKEFKKHIDNETVLFPQSEQSRKSIEHAFDTAQVHELVCYRTKQNAHEIGFADVLVFTSPSNVESFFLKNGILDYQKAMAFGYATAEAMTNHGLETVTIPKSLDAETLADTIKQLLHS